MNLTHIQNNKKSELFISYHTPFFKESINKFGTPYFFISQEALIDRCKYLKNHFTNLNISTSFYYPYKANDLPYLCTVIKDQGFCAEVSSLFELKLAIEIGVKDIIYNGPAKTKEDILEVLQHQNNNIILILDSINELKKVIEISRKKHTNVNVGIRCRPNRKGWKKFGIPLNELEEFLVLLKKEKYLILKCIHFHQGTFQRTAKIYIKALKNLMAFLKKYQELLPQQIELIDIGGGMAPGGLFYRTYFYQLCSNFFRPLKFDVKLDRFLYNFHSIDFNAFTTSIKKLYFKSIQTIPQFKNAKLVIEPGRWLVAPTMHLILKVCDIKDNKNIYTDGGINLYQDLKGQVHPIYNISKPSNQIRYAKIYGHLCMESDIIGYKYYGYPLKEGDYICIKNVGAYSQGRTWQFGKPLCSVIALENDKLKKIRERETFSYRYYRDLIVKTKRGLWIDQKEEA